MRIGLIAMSGIRVCNQELLAAGLTLPGVVERGQVVAALPSLGLLTLAGMTPDRHETVYREVTDINGTAGELEPFDLVAISTLTAQIRDAYALADRYRAAGTPVVIGGLHATAEPEEAAGHCDAVIVGEGEGAWEQVLIDAESGRLGQFYRADSHAIDLADAPMPAFDLLDIERYNRLTVQTARGCPFRCTFCASSILLADRYKQKPADRVLAEIDRILELWRRPFIELADDNSFVNRAYWKRLLPHLAERGIRWFTETDVSVGQDEELLRLLAAGGCMEVLIGLESPDSDGLAGLELRSDWKWKRLPAYRDAVRAIQSHGIRVNGCFILGLDAHGTDIFERVYDFARELELFDVQVTLQTPFPGTPLYRRLTEQGRMLEPRPWDKCTLFDVTYRPARMSVRELEDGFRNLVVRLYNDQAIAWRREIFAHKYLPLSEGRQEVAT